MLKSLLNKLALIDYYIENLVEKIFKKRWKVVGSCRQDGRCCREIGVVVEPWIVKYKFVLNIVLWWYTSIYPFYYKYYLEEEEVFIFGCTKLSEDGKCSIYKKRPPICRKYPRVQYFEKPVVFDECGYKVEENM